MSSYERAGELVGKLTAAGITATVDPRGATPPCVLVVPPARVYDVACGYTATWELWALVPGTGNADAHVALDDLVDEVATVLPLERADLQSYALSADAPTLPAYRLDIDGGHLHGDQRIQAQGWHPHPGDDADHDRLLVPGDQRPDQQRLRRRRRRAGDAVRGDSSRAGRKLGGRSLAGTVIQDWTADTSIIDFVWDHDLETMEFTLHARPGRRARPSPGRSAWRCRRRRTAATSNARLTSDFEWQIVGDVDRTPAAEVMAAGAEEPEPVPA